MSPLQLLFKNPHTTGAAIGYVFAKLGAELGAIWYPEHAAQFQKTAEVIEAAAVGWGLLSAGDASTSASAEAANSAAIQAVHDVAVTTAKTVAPPTETTIIAAVAAADKAIAALPTPKGT